MGRHGSRVQIYITVERISVLVQRLQEQNSKSMVRSRSQEEFLVSGKSLFLMQWVLRAGKQVFLHPVSTLPISLVEFQTISRSSEVGEWGYSSRSSMKRVHISDLVL